MALMTFHSVGNGMSSSQLTFTPWFFWGVGWNHQPVSLFLRSWMLLVTGAFVLVISEIMVPCCHLIMAQDPKAWLREQGVWWDQEVAWRLETVQIAGVNSQRWPKQVVWLKQCHVYHPPVITIFCLVVYINFINHSQENGMVYLWYCFTYYSKSTDDSSLPAKWFDANVDSPWIQSYLLRKCLGYEGGKYFLRQSLDP